MTDREAQKSYIKARKKKEKKEEEEQEEDKINADQS